MPMKNDREYRSFQLNIAEGEEKVVRGYATTFNNEYTLYEDEDYVIREVVDPSAFDDTDMEDVIMQFNHEGRVFARISNGTLELNVDEEGLAIEADLGGTEIGRNLYEEIAGGYTNKMSMGFKVDRTADVWTREMTDGKTVEVRRINRILKLYDVSAVSIPANDATSISVRTLVDGEIEKLRAERLEAEELELAKLRAETRARALGGHNGN